MAAGIFLPASQYEQLYRSLSLIEKRLILINLKEFYCGSFYQILS